MQMISILSWAFLIFFPITGLRRGSGPTFFTGAFILLSSTLASLLAAGLANIIPIGHHSNLHVSQGYWQAILFVPMVVAAFPLGKVFSRIFAWSFDPFDWLVGFTFGIIGALVAIRFFLASFLLAFEGSAAHETFNHLFLVRHFCHYDFWHATVKWFMSLGGPDPASQIE